MITTQTKDGRFTICLYDDDESNLMEQNKFFLSVSNYKQIDFGIHGGRQLIFDKENKIYGTCSVNVRFKKNYDNRENTFGYVDFEEFLDDLIAKGEW